MLPISRPATASEVPVIDLRGARFASDAEKRDVANKVTHACKEAGFFYIIDHGVDPEAVKDMFLAARQFFDLPLEAKEEVSLKKSDFNFRGYLPSFHKGEDPNLKENLQEAFQVHRDLPADDPDVVAPDFPARPKSLAERHAGSQAADAGLPRKDGTAPARRSSS